MNEKLQYLKEQIDKGQYQKVFDYLNLYFDTYPYNQYAVIKMNIEHQINMGFAPNPMQVQGLQMFLSSSKAKEAIIFIEKNHTATNKETTTSMPYGTEKEIEGLKKAIDLLLEKQEFLLEENQTATGKIKFGLKKDLEKIDTELEEYRQKIQKLKGENPNNSTLEDLDNKTQKAKEDIEEGLKEKEKSQPQEKKKINIFVSYSSKDRDLRELLVEGLQSHLTHRRGFEYSQWTDTQIDMGADWKETIENALEESNVAILLVSSNFAASSFINQNELTDFFKRQKEGGYLILPVLVRKYDFFQFEALSKLNFFKTYHSEYGFTRPIEKNKLLPFDKLAEGASTTDEQLNLYYEKLAEFVHTAVSNKF